MTDTIELNDLQLADSAIPSGIDPFDLFDSWFAQAQESEVNDPNAMALATANPPYHRWPDKARLHLRTASPS